MSGTALLTASEVAAIVKVSPRTINRWAASGKLTASQRLPGPTGALLFERSEIDAFLASSGAVS